MRIKLIALVVLAMLLVPGLAYAQTPAVEWTRWDALINVSSTNELQVAETQEIRVTSGSIHHGQRSWTDAVQVQNVYIILDGSSPQQLTQGNGTSPNSYRVSKSGGQTILDYELPTQTPAGNSVLIQINYAATSPTSSVADWMVVPPDHAFPVRSSTVRIRFPEGQTPDQSLVRSTGTDANVNVSGNEIVIQTTTSLAAGQAFTIQVPFGAGVGAAANSGSSAGDTGIQNPNTGAPLQPGDTQNVTGINLGSLLPIVCIIGVILLFGGGNLLRSLLGGLLGGGSGVGGASSPFGGNPLGGSGDESPYEPPVNTGSSSRGFRSSSNQDRSIGDVGSDKKRGGGANFS